MVVIKRVLRVLVIAALLLLTNCATTYSGPAGTENAVSFRPPGIYYHWADELEACSGLKGSVTAVKFWVVPERYIEGLTGPLLGRAWRPGNVYLAAIALFDKDTVKHELLHAWGVEGHPVPPYQVCAPL